PAAQPGTDEDRLESIDITKDTRAFTALVRNALFRVVKALASRDYEAALELLELPADEDEPWTPEPAAAARATFCEEHGTLRTDPVARAPKYCVIERRADAWEVRQTLLDPEEHGESFVVVAIPLAESAEEGRPVLRLVELG